MNKYISTLLSICALIVLLFSPISVSAQENTFFQTPAKHLVILDFETGEILFEKNARVPMAPASMTKIMTASVVFDRIQSGTLSLDDEFVVSEDAWRRGGVKSGSSTMFLKPKSKVKVRDLLQGVIVQSGNDACITLAEGISGSEAAFAELMNEKAKQMGLTSANFVNATGWPHAQHNISAYDLAVLAKHTITTYPELYKTYGQESFTWNGIKQPNRNPLLIAGVAGADGLKTGYTSISKYGFVGSALMDGKRRIFVVNGLKSKGQRSRESIRLMRSSFGEFKVYGLYKAGAEVGRANVYMGKSSAVPLHTAKAVNLGLHKSQRPKMKLHINYLSPIPAPITQGDYIADLVITVDGKTIKKLPLHASSNVKRKSVFGRMITSLVNKIRGQ